MRFDVFVNRFQISIREYFKRRNKKKKKRTVETTKAKMGDNKENDVFLDVS